MRVIDVVLGTIALVVLAPLMLAVAVAIRLRLGNPILFRQTRAGRDGQLFTILKFRTMDMRDARCCGNPPRCMGVQMSPNRTMTRLGSGLRRTGLDELPQLINILRGEMSIVGPRPLMPRYVGRYTSAQRRRLEVRPGITGWAQINGRTDLGWSERLELDTWYVTHRSPRLDLSILLRTIWVALSGSGYAEIGSETNAEFLGTRPMDGRCPVLDDHQDDDAVRNALIGTTRLTRPEAMAPAIRTPKS